MPGSRFLRIASPAAALLLIHGVAPAQVRIAGKDYVRLESREATRSAMVATLMGRSVEWGSWHVLAPLDHPKGADDIATPYPPEEQLARMTPGGPGPDLGPFYASTNGIAAWRQVEERPEIGGVGGAAPINLAERLPPDRARRAVGYLYRTITSSTEGPLPVTMGSDDGLRVWLNGALVVDANEERPMNPEAHRVSLPLVRGVNHLFVKVSQGAGEWQFQMGTELALDPVAEAALDWQLDEDFPDEESKYYRIATIPHPREIALEVGGLAAISNNRRWRVYACTRRGDVFRIDNAFERPALNPKFTLLASGLQEPLGLAVVHPGEEMHPPDALLVAQRSELTLIEGNIQTDAFAEFKTLCADWELSGNYHEYAFGAKLGPGPYAWVTLNLAHIGGESVMGAPVDTRGWAVKIPWFGPDSGKMFKVADGLRSPDGIGLGPDDQMFYTDNQGDYVATNKLSHLKEGSFHGHQATLRWREGYGPNWRAEGKPVPEITWPAVWFPYKKMGQSASDIEMDVTRGGFGPFTGQLFVGEQTYCQVFRVFLEKIDGEYQGACFPFRSGFRSGVHRLAFAPDGSMFVGMTDRGWGSTGPKRDGLQRIIWTGRTPFEILAMRLKPEGFELEFTLETDDDALDAGKYRVSSYTYKYHAEYGSPEVDPVEHAVVGVERAGPRSVLVTLDRIRADGMGYVHELALTGLRSAPDASGTRAPLLHDRAYYTVQRAAR